MCLTLRLTGREGLRLGEVDFLDIVGDTLRDDDCDADDDCDIKDNAGDNEEESDSGANEDDVVVDGCGNGDGYC